MVCGEYDESLVNDHCALDSGLGFRQRMERIVGMEARCIGIEARVANRIQIGDMTTSRTIVILPTTGLKLAGETIQGVILQLSHVNSARKTQRQQE